MAFISALKKAHQRYLHPEGRRVSISFHHLRETFILKTLKVIIKDQARWGKED
jgi:predicted RNA binding protein YcfA (HicA-like mRNA interferase family)